MITYFNLELVSFLLNFSHGLVSQLQLMRQMVDVTLKCLNLRDVVLFLLLKLFDHERRSTRALFHVEALLIQLVVLVGQLLDGFLVPLGLSASIAIILQHVLLVYLESAQSLLRHSLLLLQLLGLPLEELIGLRRLCKLLIDEPIFTRQRLNVLSQLRALLRLHLDDLR